MSDVAAGPGPTLGEALRAARTTAGRSVEQVSAATRIRAQLVRDLEDDRLDSCGGAVYARGHVRAIAHALGVDAAALVTLFDAQSGTHPPAPVGAPPLPPPRSAGATLHVPVAAPPERDGPRWVQAATAALAVVVGLLAIGTFGGARQVVADPATDTVPAPSAPPAASTAAPPAPAPAPAPPPAGARLGLRVEGGEAWISVATAGRVLFEGTAEDGWARTFHEPGELRLTTGNAGALRVSCGGGMGAPAGAAGAVVRLTCGQGGLVRP